MIRFFRTNWVALVAVLVATSIAAMPAYAAIVKRWRGQVVFPASGIILAGTTVTATGADLNFIDVAAAGTLEASKALVADASSQIDTVDVTGSYQMDGNPIIQCDNVTVSSAEVLALNATPKTLVAAPGANLFVAVHSVTLALDYATTAYDGVAAGEDLTIAYTNGSGADAAPPIETTGFLDQANDELRVTFATGTVVSGGAATAALEPVSNAAVVLSLDTGEIATGDSPLDVRICYAVMPDLLD